MRGGGRLPRAILTIERDFMSENPKFYAVLTGDIVNSTALAPDELESVRGWLSDAIDEVKHWKRGLVRGNAEFFRGDAWQLLLAEPALALRTAVFLRASLLAEPRVDSRVSIGLGRVEKISRGRISLSTGEAFSLSGRALDQMTQYSRMTIEVPQSAGAMAAWFPVIAGLCDSLISQWTARQAEIVCLAITPGEQTQEEIAETLVPAVSRQAVTKALDSANWHSIRAAIRQFETTDWPRFLQ